MEKEVVAAEMWDFYYGISKELLQYARRNPGRPGELAIDSIRHLGKWIKSYPKPLACDTIEA